MPELAYTNGLRTGIESVVVLLPTMSIVLSASPTPTSRLESSWNNTSTVTSEPTGSSPALAVVPSEPSKLVSVIVPIVGDVATTLIDAMFAGRSSGSLGNERLRSSAPVFGTRPTCTHSRG